MRLSWVALCLHKAVMELSPGLWFHRKTQPSRASEYDGYISSLKKVSVS